MSKRKRKGARKARTDGEAQARPVSEAGREAAKARPGARRKLWTAAGTAALVLLVGVAYLNLIEPPATQTALQQAPEDVVYGRVIHAVHEMGAGPPIPFLPEDRPQPRVEVPVQSHDFGTIGPTAVVRKGFIIRNTGQGPLTISRAYTTCGCTTADISARVIPPGKAAKVILTFDAGFHDTRGQTVRRGLVIESNDRGNAKAEIWVRARVRRT